MVVKKSILAFGTKAKDTVTGFTGIVTGRAEYLGEMPSLRLTAENGQDDLSERWVVESCCEPVAEERKAGFSSK